MNAHDAVFAITLASLTAVLLYGVLTIYVGAHRPGDRPTWGDLCEMLAGIAGAVLGSFQPSRGEVEKP